MNVVANYKKAREESEKILRENFISEPPIFPRELASNYGLNVKFVEFDDKFEAVAGYLSTDEKIIYVNSKDSPKRQTFTIAHELGHWILHRSIIEKNPENYNVLLRLPLGRTDTDPLEKEANCFAANLLVPKKMLDKYKDFATIQQLADLFIVSQDVVRFNLEHNS